MTKFHHLVIEPLNDDHNRSAFQCGIEALDNYLKKLAKQDIKRRISRVFVATQPDDSSQILGYYTLSALSIHLNELPEALARKLPRNPIPAALIGRLAVSQHAQGYGIGKMLLVNAIKRTLAVSGDIAIYAMVVDAINDEARSFYEKFCFIGLSPNSNRLFLPLKTPC